MSREKKPLCVGILAHVDAGKTTLSEAILYTAGVLPAMGRVDHRDAFLDTHALERARGITIFSKQARFETERFAVTLLDTPGHVDFSSEMERALSVLDYAVLVISASDGVQAHTETLWRLLRRHEIPTFLFITKTDLPNPGREAVLEDLRRRLDEGCVAFSPRGEDWSEAVALRDEGLLETYLDTGALPDRDVAGLIRLGKVFPCCFGAGLRAEGVRDFLDCLDRWAEAPAWGPDFAARVYQIARDTQGNRMTFLRLTGGSLSVRAPVAYLPQEGEEAVEEKVTALRLYSGARFQTAERVEAGQVAAVLGLTRTFPGQGLGAEPPAPPPLLEPVLTYRLLLPDGCDPRTFLPKLKQLEEEDPQLHILWDPRLQEIHARLMGQVQIEVLQSLIRDRFDVEVGVDAGRILYRETIAAPVEGVGHFEPLRHYAEVHLLLEPLDQGAGLVLDTRCPEDLLDRNWQRLILTHLAEKTHVGVLTGSPITDLRITLMSGRAHVKHTEGGDFRQATYRAVRQGLMQAESVLLEPWYEFRLEVPADQLGRAISDLQGMSARFEAPENDGEWAVLTGSGPVSAMKDYPLTLAAYTRGRGRFFCSFGGYRPCHDQDRVVEAAGYQPEHDTENTPDSVFCSHGAGVTVKWDRVKEYMHLESCLRPDRSAEEPPAVPRVYTRNLDLDDKELEAIFTRTFGPIRDRGREAFLSQKTAPAAQRVIAPPKQQYLIVDGYNMIFAWDVCRDLARDSIDAARQRLMDILSNYRAYKGCELVLVFDAYRVKGGQGAQSDYHGMHVVFTRQDETGDAFIERLVEDIGPSYAVRVATSDALIQLSALRKGVLRVSAAELWREVEAVGRQIDQAVADYNRANPGINRPHLGQTTGKGPSKGE